MNYQELSHKSLTFPLPLCAFKFLEFPMSQRLSPADFKLKWQKNSHAVLSTEPLRINHELIRNFQDLLDIFPNAQFLNKNPQNPLTKWGVVATFFGKLTVFLKLVFFEKYTVIAQICVENDRETELFSRIKAEILASFEFIFCN